MPLKARLPVAVTKTGSGSYCDTVSVVGAAGSGRVVSAAASRLSVAPCVAVDAALSGSALSAISRLVRAAAAAAAAAVAAVAAAARAAPPSAKHSGQSACSWSLHVGGAAGRVVRVDARAHLDHAPARRRRVARDATVETSR